MAPHMSLHISHLGLSASQVKTSSINFLYRKYQLYLSLNFMIIPPLVSKFLHCCIYITSIKIWVIFVMVNIHYFSVRDYSPNHERMHLGTRFNYYYLSLTNLFLIQLHGLHLTPRSLHSFKWCYSIIISWMSLICRTRVIPLKVHN